MKRVLLLIRQLNLGGAQRQLVALAKGLDKAKYDVTVLTFYPGGCFASALEGDGRIRLLSLEKRGRWDTVGFFWRFSRAIRQLKPDICYSFLGGSNLLSILARCLRPGILLIWSIRGSEVDFLRYDWAERLTSRLENFFSRYADRTIANSSAGLVKAVAHGFPRDRVSVVANGVDTDFFRPDEGKRQVFRESLGLAADTCLIGMVARPDPMKGHEIFLRAAALLKAEFPSAHYLVCGCGEGRFACELFDLARSLGLEDNCIWLGREENMPALFNALDLLVSASLFGEGFANVLAEAMACGTPCVATDVGDSALILGDTGQVVFPGSPEALAEGMGKMLTRKGEDLIDVGAIRQRITGRFGLTAMVQATEELFCRP